MSIDKPTVKKLGERVKQVGQDMIDAVAPPKQDSRAVMPTGKQGVAEGPFQSSQKPDDALQDAKKSLGDILREIDELLP